MSQINANVAAGFEHLMSNAAVAMQASASQDRVQHMFANPAQGTFGPVSISQICSNPAFQQGFNCNSFGMSPTAAMTGISAPLGNAQLPQQSPPNQVVEELQQMFGDILLRLSNVEKMQEKLLSATTAVNGSIQTLSSDIGLLKASSAEAFSRFGNPKEPSKQNSSNAPPNSSQTSSSPAAQGSKVWVGRFPGTFTETQVRNLFNGIGTIQAFKRLSVGSAIIEFANQQQAANALRINGSIPSGSKYKLKVEECRPFKPASKAPNSSTSKFHPKGGDLRNHLHNRGSNSSRRAPTGQDGNRSDPMHVETSGISASSQPKPAPSPDAVRQGGDAGEKHRKSAQSSNSTEPDAKRQRPNTPPSQSQESWSIDTLNRFDALRQLPDSDEPFSGGTDEYRLVPPSSPLAVGQREKLQQTYDVDNHGNFIPTYERLNAKLRTLNPPMTSVNQKGDGNCAWRAISYSMRAQNIHGTNVKTFQNVKQLVLAGLPQRKDVLRDFLLSKAIISSDDQGWYDNLEYELTKDGQQANEISLAVAAAVLDIDIDIWNTQTCNLTAEFRGFEGSGDSQPRQKVTLAYRPEGLPIYDSEYRCFAWTQGHYLAVVQLKGNDDSSEAPRH